MLFLALQKGLNGQNHASSHFHHQIKKFPTAKVPILPIRGTPPYLPLNAIWKTLMKDSGVSHLKNWLKGVD